VLAGRFSSSVEPTNKNCRCCDTFFITSYKKASTNAIDRSIDEERDDNREQVVCPAGHDDVVQCCETPANTHGRHDQRPVVSFDPDHRS
jgi:hypothetical protein